MNPLKKLIDILKTNNIQNTKSYSDILPTNTNNKSVANIKKEKSIFNLNSLISKYNEYKKNREKEKEDLNIYESLSKASNPNIEYYLLTILSCIIATTGLLQGSSAVIIGAMIIAPLMSPILGFSLGVIWGDLKLIKKAFSSISKGVIISILISTFISFFVPITNYNNEILSRTHPNLFDIVVAIASGLAGAYGNANKKISNTLVGIAITVALMPPLCTIGIGFGKFDYKIAIGALNLFTINLISISLSAAIIFWIMKIHPKNENQETINKRAISQIIISLFLLTIIAIPVGIYSFNSLKLQQAKQKVCQISKDQYGDNLFDVSFVGNQNDIDITITAFYDPYKQVDSKKLINKINVRIIQTINNKIE